MAMTKELDPSDGVFGRFDLAALCGCHTLNVCYVMLCIGTWPLGWILCTKPSLGAAAKAKTNRAAGVFEGPLLGTKRLK